jgi:hypothetical protein
LNNLSVRKIASSKFKDVLLVVAAVPEPEGVVATGGVECVVASDGVEGVVATGRVDASVIEGTEGVAAPVATAKGLGTQGGWSEVASEGASVVAREGVLLVAAGGAMTGEGPPAVVKKRVIFP